MYNYYIYINKKKKKKKKKHLIYKEYVNNNNRRLIYANPELNLMLVNVVVGTKCSQRSMIGVNGYRGAIMLS
jgi:hypothetical protein